MLGYLKTAISCAQGQDAFHVVKHSARLGQALQAVFVFGLDFFVAGHLYEGVQAQAS